ncbi:hypothetical protein [Bowmanella dokdonensis]|uniref:DUF4476 domain-containing protein n=1 Tax=Bowmanella dokdonensis TaxID=751969 RepID=A0A939DNW8_9ALTE|nr:hypothetical protein [Bowmanella dokdonensis]MBN7826249.1 hypothetical protein [Bowmanella dokdonensis]
MNTPLACLSLIALLSPVSVLAQVSWLDCEERAQNLTFSALTYHQLGYPANLSADLLGLVREGTDAQLVRLAFDRLEQGLDEAAVTQALHQHCQSLPAAELDKEQSFFAEDGNTQVQLMACSTLLGAVFDQYSLPEQELVLNMGVQSDSLAAQLIADTLAKRSQGQSAKQAVGEVFEQCSDFSEQQKRQLAAELSME